MTRFPNGDETLVSSAKHRKDHIDECEICQQMYMRGYRTDMKGESKYWDDWFADTLKPVIKPLPKGVVKL